MSGFIDTIAMGSSGIDLDPMPTEVGQPAWDIARFYPAQGQWTEEQYLELARRVNRHVEFEKGVIEILPMPSIEHQLLVKFLLRRLDDFVEARGLGAVLTGPVPVWITEARYREPDILYVTNERHAASDKHYRGVDLALEIVSPDDKSRQRDHVEKVEAYAEAGVAEYWIVDPQERRVRVLTLEGGKYVEHANLVGEGTATSRLLEGFSLDVAEALAAGRKR